MKVLVTGSAGLVGTALSEALKTRGHQVVAFDRRIHIDQDVQSPPAVQAAMGGCDGVVHLAATSRVTWAEDAPEEAWANNVGGTRNVLEVAAQSPHQPWVLYASSREVYGPQADGAVVTEDAPLAPMNTYARTKVEGERMMSQAAAAGLGRAVVRFSNIYGAADDHLDRVVPAFLRAALSGATLTVEGADNAFDFVYLSDAIEGAMRLIDRLERALATPPIQLVTGTSTTLGELAQMALEVASETNGALSATIAAGSVRPFDVRAFSGAATRAKLLLDWEATVSLREGLRRMASDIVSS